MNTTKSIQFQRNGLDSKLNSTKGTDWKEMDYIVNWIPQRVFNSIKNALSNELNTTKGIQLSFLIDWIVNWIPLRIFN